MRKVKVKKVGDWEFAVEVEENGEKTAHRVILAEDFARRFNLAPEEVVEQAFEFLLAREPKESILSSFSIPDTINRFFPNFEAETTAG